MPQSNFDFAKHVVTDIVRAKSENCNPTPFAAIRERFLDQNQYPEERIDQGKSREQTAELATSFLVRRQKIEKDRHGSYWLMGQVPPDLVRRRRKKHVPGRDREQNTDQKSQASRKKPPVPVSKTVLSYASDQISQIVVLDHGKAETPIDATGKMVTIILEDPPEKQLTQEVTA